MEIWNSRRSPVLSKNGICSSSQPLASAAGIRVLQNGGTAADAAVAMAAALNVTEPCSTGIGGDAFALYYKASTKEVFCLQGNGASSAHFNLDLLKERGFGHGDSLLSLDPHSGLCVTVPGAAAMWEDLLSHHGRLTLAQVLAPAIELAEDGFPVAPVTAKQWSGGFLQGEEALRVFRPNGHGPRAGDVLTNPDLAKTFRDIAEYGTREAFYSGRIAEAVVAAAQEYGGVMDLDDLEYHRTAFENPTSTVYKGVRVYETPPPTHGLAALVALRLIEEVERLNPTATTANQAANDTPSFDFSAPNLSDRGSEYQAHIAIECMRVGFAEALQHICDPRSTEFQAEDVLLSDEYIKATAAKINTAISSRVTATDFSVFEANETVYFCVVDREGNACSMINSNYTGFGSGIVPKGCGFTLHNRGHNFSLQPGHPNQAAPRKRPYHTIIPALATNEKDGSLYGVFGNMGGFMQPMGHVQLLRNLVDFHMDPQAALDAPRWYVHGPGRTQSVADVEVSEVAIEDGYGGAHDGAAAGGSAQDGRRSVIEGLRARGHIVGSPVVGYERSLYGRGQIILRNNDTGVLWGGSEPRADGCAMPVP